MSRSANCRAVIHHLPCISVENRENFQATVRRLNEGRSELGDLATASPRTAFAKVGHSYTFIILNSLNYMGFCIPIRILVSENVFGSKGSISLLTSKRTLF